MPVEENVGSGRDDPGRDNCGRNSSGRNRDNCGPDDRGHHEVAEAACVGAQCEVDADAIGRRRRRGCTRGGQRSVVVWGDPGVGIRSGRREFEDDVSDLIACAPELRVRFRR